MQTCSRCSSNAPDDAQTCPKCQADLREWSETAVALKKMQANPRVKAIHVFVQDDCCPTCAKVKGSFAKDNVPPLPVEGCSHPNGCRCFYAPILDEIYP